MASIRIPVTSILASGLFPRTFLDECGQVQLIPWLRLSLTILVGHDPEPGLTAPRLDRNGDPRLHFPAILDTGAPITVFPRKVWELVEPDITRLRWNPEEMEQQPVAWRTPTATVGGSTFPYFLGHVWVEARDIWGRSLPAVRVLTMFREDLTPPGQMTPNILLGLSGGILEDRRFSRSPVDDRYDPDPPGLQTYAQWWWLSDHRTATS